jgi:ribonuclease HII
MDLMDRRRGHSGCGTGTLSIAEIRTRWFAEGAERPPEKVLAGLAADRRRGVRDLVLRAQRRWDQQEKRLHRGRELLRHESPLWERGIEFVAGVDEAGMGPLAGPVIASAVVLPQGFLLPGLDDSKILTARRREEFYSVLHDTALGIGVGQAEPEEVDRLNIYQAGLLAMVRAVAALPVQPQHLLIDARRLDALSIPQESLVGGDRRSASIAAASVVAKVTRDRIMLDFHGLYPRYGFDRNKGYPTAEHRAAVSRFGHSPIHRRTFMSGAADTHKSPGNHAPEAV